MIGNYPPLVGRGRTFFVDLNPVQGHEQAGLRPAVVVSSPEVSAAGIVIVVPTTTRRLDRLTAFEVRIPAGRGVPEDSKAIANQLRVIDVSQRLKDPIGRVDEDVMDLIDTAIMEVFFGPRIAA